jgi:hypothetical protein
MKQGELRGGRKQRDALKSHLIAEESHDPYRSRKKLPEPAVCKQCMAVLTGGRWQWTAKPLEGAHWELCPACHRIADKYPAGELTLTGSFLKAHGAEIVRLARNVEAMERREHPLQRIMEVAEEEDRIVITTTGLHLPRWIAHAVTSAYKGDLETHYDEAGHFVRMTWRRDERVAR